MTTERMTVHEALSNLKVLDARIEKLIRETKFVYSKKHSDEKVTGVPVQNVIEKIQSAYQKITDLLRRRDALKRAVVLSNAQTTVTIGEKEYTVAEAIEMKNHGVNLVKQLVVKMDDDFSGRAAEIERGNQKVETRADDYVKSLFSNGTDLKSPSEEVKKVREDFVKSQTLEMIDPLDVKKKMSLMVDSIEKFMSEVDSALSISNALTYVTIEY